MPIHSMRDDVRRRLTLTLREEVSAQEVARFIASEPPVPTDEQPYDILVDMRFALVGVETSAQAQALATLASGRDPTRQGGRIALVANDDATFGIARMYAAYRGKSGITLEVFRRIEDADAWLTSSSVRRSEAAITYQRDDRRRRINVTLVGEVSVEDLLAIVDRQAAEGTWQYGVWYDARRVTKRVDGTPAEARRVLEHVLSVCATHGARGPVAIVTDRPADYAIARTYSNSGIAANVVVEVFRDPSDAERWLSSIVPVS